MKCPSCRIGILQSATIDHLFSCKTCNHCKGNWILLVDYMNWKNSSHEMLPVDPKGISPTETKNALICPIHGTLMTKYRISYCVDNRIDFSSSAAAIWLDYGEWSLLKKLGLADQLNNIVTADWQKKLREEMRIDLSDKRYTERFGEEDYLKIKEIRDWLINHPQGGNLFNYLNSANPWLNK